MTGWNAPLSGGITYYYYTPALASTANVQERFNDPLGKLSLAYTGPSPDGGRFIGFDADYVGDAPPSYGPYNSTFVQTITGLEVGKKYNLSYYWAATQLQNRSGQTTNFMTASLGSESYSTATLILPSQGFSGWAKVTATFTAQAASDTLTFLAKGTPAGGPPFTLLASVSLTAAVPEAAPWAMMIAGFGLVGTAARRHRSTMIAASAKIVE